MAITKTLWGHHEAQEIYLITLTNGYLSLSLSNLGCTIVSLMVPLHTGGFTNVVLGYDSLEGYVNDPYYTGCIIGRFAGRIGGAGIHIGGTYYALSANEASTGNHLHGGSAGFNKKVFSITNTVSWPGNNSIQFHYKSLDSEEGYPGNLNVFITYCLTNDNEIIIGYEATADKVTPVNLTSHGYFNLSSSQKDATRQELFINGDTVLVSDAHYIPTGGMKPVKATHFDFTTWRKINNNVDDSLYGYNDCFVLNDADNPMAIKAGLRDAGSGISMTLKTSLPGLVLYTGDFLGAPFTKNQGICLEAQFFPDSPNHTHFPSTLLQPGKVYQHQTVYQFLTY